MPTFRLSLLALILGGSLFAQTPPDDDAFGPPIDEFFGTGLEFDEAAYRAVPYKAPVTAETYANLPSSASLENYAPTPGNQGPYSTCTAFAVAYHMRTILYGIEKGITNRAQLDAMAFSPSFVYEQIKSPDTVDCKKGTSLVTALELLRTTGVPPSSYVPYRCGAEFDTTAVLKATEFPIIDYQILFSSQLDEADPFKSLAIKKSLAEGSPVVIGFVVHQSFYTAGEIWRQLESDGGATGQHGKHAMVVVGYDDTKFGGAFRLINSWGTQRWGDKGFVWIPYADFNRNCFMAMQAYGKRPARKPSYAKPGDTIATLPPLLAGEVVFQERDGTPMPARLAPPLKEGEVQTRYLGYQMLRSYRSGTRFRFFVKTSTQAYLYAFATDLTGVITKILPFDDNMSPLVGPDSSIAFPSERKVVRMDTTPGTDYLLMLYSEERLDVDELMKAMNANPGTLSLKIHQALGDRIVNDSFIKKSPDRISFTLTEKTRSTVVPLMIEITHD